MSVYTELSRARLEEILRRYDLGGLVDYAGIPAGIENSNYFLDCGNGRFVLTIFERMARGELPWFMRLMVHLRRRGAPTPEVQRRDDGSMLFEVEGKAGCIVSRLPGEVVEHLSIPRLRNAGEVLAGLHEAAASFAPPRANPTGTRWLEETAAAVRDGVRERYGEEAAALLADELAWQRRRPRLGLPEGIIHGDYFCDNILFDGDAVSGVIDLYYAHSAPWAMDVAIAINALAVVEGEEDEERIAAFLDGYQRRRPLSDPERRALPGLLRLAALRFWLSRLYDAIFPRPGAMTRIKDPEEYRRKLLIHRH